MTLSRKVYWDASVFIALITDEPERGAACAQLFQEVQEVRGRIYTSVIGLTECSGGQSVAKLYAPQLNDLNAKIRGFFRNPLVTAVNVDPIVAQRAQELQQWCRKEHGFKLKPFDAIHAATAIRAGVEEINSYDKHLLRLNGKTLDGANRSLIVEAPVLKPVVRQISLPSSDSQ